MSFLAFHTDTSTICAKTDTHQSFLAANHVHPLKSNGQVP